MTENNKTTKAGVSGEALIDIPLEGALGLLAYGDLGITAWRNAKKKAYWEMMKEREENTDSDSASANTKSNE